MRSIHVFIVSWAGQHRNAVSIAESVAGAATRLAIVYSDPDPALALDAKCDLIRRPNELFWGDKFKACLDACRGDLMLVIHADCRCEDWARLVRRCQSAMSDDPGIGVWAPLIDGTPFRLDRVRLMGIGSTSLTIVTHTDGIVFGLAPPVIERMRQANYDGNVHGWGIELMAVASSFANRMFAVIDQAVAVMHPRSRGYDEAAARDEMQRFLKQLTAAELLQWALLTSRMRLNDLTAAAPDRPPSGGAGGPALAPDRAPVPGRTDSQQSS